MPAKKPINKKRRGATSGATVAALERKEEAVRMRKNGLSFQAIGEALGVSKQAAHGLVTGAMREHIETTKEEAEQLVALEEMRLDDLLRAWLPAALTGDDKAAGIVLKVGERRSKLRGLDAASKTELTGKDGGPLASVVASTPLDLSKLSAEQLSTLEGILKQAAPSEEH